MFTAMSRTGGQTGVPPACLLMTGGQLLIDVSGGTEVAHPGQLTGGGVDLELC